MSQPQKNPKISSFLESRWPTDKPTLQIVFPQLVDSGQAVLPSQWTMLPKKRIEENLYSPITSHFMCLINPHPMVLWITVVYNLQERPCWLPCFLDMKSYQGQKFLRILSQVDYYPILFFTLEKPNNCIHYRITDISLDQRSCLKAWLLTSQTSIILNNNIDERSNLVKESKNVLNTEFEKIKPQFLNKLESLAKLAPFYSENTEYSNTLKQGKENAHNRQKPIQAVNDKSLEEETKIQTEDIFWID